MNAVRVSGSLTRVSFLAISAVHRSNAMFHSRLRAAQLTAEAPAATDFPVSFPKQLEKSLVARGKPWQSFMLFSA